MMRYVHVYVPNSICVLSEEELVLQLTTYSSRQERQHVDGKLRIALIPHRCLNTI